jgi:hypothetical protein
VIHEKLISLDIDAKGGQGWGRGGRGGGDSTSRQIFEKLIHKNAIKSQNSWTPWQFFLKALTPPPGIWAKTWATPLTWIFNSWFRLLRMQRMFINCVSLCYRENDEKIKDDLITKLKSNIPEANITSEVGPGGYYFI